MLGKAVRRLLNGEAFSEVAAFEVMGSEPFQTCLPGAMQVLMG